MLGVFSKAIARALERSDNGRIAIRAFDRDSRKLVCGLLQQVERFSFLCGPVWSHHANAYVIVY